ncbi:hypothetical protein [Streptomyces sp. NPDC058382]
MSTERPGPTRVAPSVRLKPSLAPEARALNLAVSGGALVRRTTP